MAGADMGGKDTYLPPRRRKALPKRRKKPPLGTGQRFAQLTSQLAQRPGVTNPAALAAAIGRRKYGAAKFARLGRGGK